ncbi:endonuclease/exonuclease/phosphatase family protein [uncultured Shewanella sp.]|uniref:endonuclease/exonuclease/phosphatase family protein n=1 Tax=uncultured Shewanella sp. TaxID=173975 RepID=UPI002616E442|nr:endonuclease/exonuclease/phosphatase family protein [uncultured Shewanella sp.]
MSDRDEIKIATLNLFNFMEPPGAYYDFDNIYTHQEWQKKLAWIAQFLSKAKPDVIAFQEVFSGEALKAFIKAQGYPYFAIAGEPVPIADHVYDSPVVAIASRYPIEYTLVIEADPRLAGSMGLISDFRYSRSPLLAGIKLPHVGSCEFYVVHFKSKRPTIEPVQSAYQVKSLPSEPTEQIEIPTIDPDNVGQVLAENVLGTWASSIQRGTEAAMLLSNIIKRRQHSHLPFVLMGDFNDAMSGDILSHLLTHELRFFRPSIGELSDFCIRDAFDLYQGSLDLVFELPRAATHYYGAQGMVLDYILLSSEFVPTDKHNMAVVSQYQIFDEHLVNPQYEHDSQSSDHAPVMISLQPREYI